MVAGSLGQPLPNHLGGFPAACQGSAIGVARVALWAAMLPDLSILCHASAFSGSASTAPRVDWRDRLWCVDSCRQPHGSQPVAASNACSPCVRPQDGVARGSVIVYYVLPHRDRPCFDAASPPPPGRCVACLSIRTGGCLCGVVVAQWLALVQDAGRNWSSNEIRAAPHSRRIA